MHNGEFWYTVIVLTTLTDVTATGRYVDQTSRCINAGLREPHWNVLSGNTGYLRAHYKDCAFAPFTMSM